jgi:AcrR family transcriptional regulator
VSSDLAARESSTPIRVPRGRGREALLAALVRVAGRDGLDGVTHRSVAVEAGVTHGLATYHFASRDDMVSEALVWATRRAIEDSRLAEAGTSLDDFARDVPRHIAANPDNAAFQFETALEGRRRPDIGAEVRDLYDTYVEAVEDVLESHGLGRDRVLARLVFAAIDGLSLQQLIYGDPAPTEACLARLRDLLALVAER